MYSVSSILREANRLFHTRFYNRDYNPSGVDVIEKDWDNLIILDACRYDVFKDVADLPGETEHAISPAGTSSEFIRACFSDRTLYDTIYVGSNAWFQKLREEINADVFKFDLVERLDADEITSPPSRVTDRAIKHYHDHPDKRLIIHYIQPHHPYLGETGQKYFTPRGETLADTLERHQDAIQDPHEKLRTAYRENLELALTEVERLLEEIPGKSVITADHGEFLGERCWPIPVREYGHHRGLYVDELVKVPWHTYETAERREVRSETPEDRDKPTDEEVIEHLEDLGYAV